jgi:hypothetical protein
MNKVILAAVLATLASASAFAQSYSPGYGSGNIAPNVTADNPDGVYRYKSTEQPRRVASTHRAHAAYAQAPSRVPKQTQPVR